MSEPDFEPPASWSWAPSLDAPIVPAKLLRLNQLLEAQNWPTMSPWWLEQIGNVYGLGRKRNAFRVGRRGGKSTTVCRIAVYESLFVRHDIPPGDEGVFGIVSANRDQAKDRLNTIKATFEALDLGGVKYYSDRVILPERRIAIRVFTASHAGVVGNTAIGYMFDEITRWRDSDTGRNPAKEVISSAMPSIATMPLAKAWFISAPFSTVDLHYAMVAEGTTNYQYVGEAPTWVANPTLSIEGTKELEPDNDIWLREFGIIPTSSEESKFLSAALLKEASISFETRDNWDPCKLKGAPCLNN